MGGFFIRASDFRHPPRAHECLPNRLCFSCCRSRTSGQHALRRVVVCDVSRGERPQSSPTRRGIRLSQINWSRAYLHVVVGSKRRSTRITVTSRSSYPLAIAAVYVQTASRKPRLAGRRSSTMPA